MEIEVAKLIGTMAVCFPSVNISEETVAMYTAALRDIPLNVLEAAVEQCILESEFFPTLAKLRAKACELTTPRRKIGTEAYGVLQNEISRTGFYRQPQFSCPLIAQAVNALGWQNLCSSENLVADRARFIQVYEQLLQREIDNARLGPKARALRELTDSVLEVKEIGDGRAF